MLLPICSSNPSEKTDRYCNASVTISILLLTISPITSTASTLELIMVCIPIMVFRPFSSILSISGSIFWLVSMIISAEVIILWKDCNITT